MRRRKTTTRTRMVPHTRDGRTHMVEEQYTVPAPPKLPRDWERIALRVAVGLALALTVVGVVWSTVSIGAVLDGGVGYAAAVPFDVAWGVALILEWLSRYDRERRRFPQRLGWALLALSMAAIATHGIREHDWALAAVGASVSLVAKGLWWAVMRHVHRELSPADAQWVEAERSASYAKLAVGKVRREVSRDEARARAELLAAERLYGVGTVEVTDPRTQAPRTPEPEAQHEHQDRPTHAPVPESAARKETDDTADTMGRAARVLELGQAIARREWPGTAHRQRDVLDRAVTAQLRARAVASTHGYGPEWHEASRAADEALSAALDAGITLADVQAEAERQRTAVRPDVSGHPQPPVSAQVTAPDPVSGIRTQAPRTPEPDPQHEHQDQEERVPAQRPPSLRAGVDELMAAGHQDPAVVTARMRLLFGNDVSEETVGRYMREFRKARSQRTDGHGEGLYL
ncbi:hypothetical protein [Streptomyces albus]|uniref:hypothetical protein n=1 Tax=Streptomyces albus TaxID=1888 RepID=UPI0024E0C2A5|nr:hypothetical protein [Streptomyces albus]GHJ24444.1 hypothetical protein TPA0909_60580 [Streptomyces albus]